MQTKRILSLILSLSFIICLFPSNFAVAVDSRRQRSVYIHAQGVNPKDTPNVSTVYTDQNADIYFAVDNPNMGEYLKPEDDDKESNKKIKEVKESETIKAAAEADKKGYTGEERDNYIKKRVSEAVALERHTEPQYDMNGYTVTMYFDPVYFEYLEDSEEPIIYDVPDSNFPTSDEGNEDVGGDNVDAPQDVGYYVRNNKKLGQIPVNGKNYEAATITVFFNGGYLPQKKDDDTSWYNLCKLPLKIKDGRTGSTQVFIDTGGEEEKTLELFAKNKSEELNEQTFIYNAENGGYHTIVIKDRMRPEAPTATPNEGSYTETQYVTLKAEEGCDIYYSLHGEEPVKYDNKPIKIDITTTITCYAQRKDAKSNTVKYTYRILPKAPYLFEEKDGTKELIPNICNKDDEFTVYASDKEVYGSIENESEIYYTFSEASAENIVEGNDPETGWVKLDKQEQSIEITKKRKIRLVTKKLDEFSEVAEYHLGIRPAAPTSNEPSGEFDKKIKIELSTVTSNARIYYTLDGSDPISNGILYDGSITLAKDTTLRAVAEYDGIYSEVSSYFYIFTTADDFGVDAFYPSGVYEGDVSVTLTANNPDNDIKYSTDNGESWKDYDKTLLIDKDTEILAKAGKDDAWGDVYTFTYKIKPLPPKFAPESTQFTNASTISVYCIENTSDNTERFSLYYTLDGSDPTTSDTRIQAEENYDAAEIDIAKDTVVKAVVLKDGKTYSSVVTNFYDIVNKKPTKPMVTLPVGNYTRKIGDDSGFETKFIEFLDGNEIYYTISYDGKFKANPEPNTNGTIKYDKNPIEVKGHTIIKAVTVNIFGVKSDVGVFEYIVTPEAPRAAPSATISGDRLPIVPVSAVVGSTVKYEINGFENEFNCESGRFYIDTQTGNAYADNDCTVKLGRENNGTFASPAELSIKSELDGIESPNNYYIYKLSDNANDLARPYADKETGEYEEAKVDADNNLLHIRLSSLNLGDKVQYKLNNTQDWTDYNGDVIKIKNDTILQIRSEKNGKYSAAASYVYKFVPLAPIITLESGRYVLSSKPNTKIEYDPRAPQDKIDNDEYYIWYSGYLENGDMADFPYSIGYKMDIDHTMSLKAYVKNETTGRVSKNAIKYYIVEPETSLKGSVYIASPYDVSRISAAVLDTGEYAKGIKLLTQNKDAEIHYYYTYTLKDSDDSFTTDYLKYNNVPITVNPSMTSIEITAWLEDSDGGKIENSKYVQFIEFVHLKVPQTSLGNDKVEFESDTQYTIKNDYPNEKNILIYYTLDGSDPASEKNSNRILYKGETLQLTDAVTVKTVYMSACGNSSCRECDKENYALCSNKIYGRVGEYKYTTPTEIITGGGGGGGGGRVNGVTDNTRKYTKDIFGTEHPTHISYINGYPDGSVKPDGKITREEMTAVLYRITNHAYEKPFVATGDVFSDIDDSRWSSHDIEYMADKKIINGYPDGEFKPQNNLSRAEFAALICRFAQLEDGLDENSFSDLDEEHWAYKDILSLAKSGLVEGYEDGSFRPQNEITRAEVMTVVNKILGRNPSKEYVKSLEFDPYTDLIKEMWYYTDVLEATVTHDYYLNDNGLEIKWENCK